MMRSRSFCFEASKSRSMYVQDINKKLDNRYAKINTNVLSIYKPKVELEFDNYEVI